MNTVERNETLFTKNKLSNFDDFLSSTNISSMKMEVDNNPELKEYIYGDLNDINISYLSPYKKYGINMQSLQNELIKHGFDLGKYGSDGDFGSFTLIAIINLQKSLGLEVNGLVDEKFLKFIFPNVFRTLNKKEGRSVNETIDYVKSSIYNYNDSLEVKKNTIRVYTKEKIKEVKSCIIDNSNENKKDKVILTSNKNKIILKERIIKYKENEKIQISVLNNEKKNNDLIIFGLNEKLENTNELLENTKNLNKSFNNDWNPFNNDEYKDEIDILKRQYDNIKNNLLVEAFNKRIDIQERIDLFNENREFTDYDENGLLININKDHILEKQKINIDYVIKKDDTIWSIIMNEIGSESIARLSNGIKIFPSDIVQFREGEITIDGKNGDYKIDISKGKYDFFPKFKMKKVEKTLEKKLVKKKEAIFVEDKKKIISEDIEEKKETEYLVKKGDLLRRIIYKHYNNHKIANLFNDYGNKLSIGDKVIFRDDNVELKGEKIDEVVLIGSAEEIVEIQNDEIKEFMNLSISERFEKITTLTNDGYFIIDFNKNFDKKTAKILEKKVTIDDIIPNKYNSCEVIVNTENKVWRKGKKKIAHKNYFDVVNRNEGDIFKSELSGKKYNKTIIKDGYAIKPFVKNFKDFDNTLINKNTNNGILKTVSKNEIFIRNMYGEQITGYINKYFKGKGSVINERFIYSLLKQESSFDPNALSHTGTRGLAMITLDTALGIMKNNKSLLKNKEFIKNNPGIENLLITNMDSITSNEKFEKYNESKGWFHGVDTQFYNPENSIKLSLSYLMSIENTLSFIKDPDLRKDAILATYNGGTIVRSILKNDSNIDSWYKLKIELKKELTVAKYKEVVGYVNIIRKTC